MLTVPMQRKRLNMRERAMLVLGLQKSEVRSTSDMQVKRRFLQAIMYEDFFAASSASLAKPKPSALRSHQNLPSFASFVVSTEWCRNRHSLPKYASHRVPIRATEAEGTNQCQRKST